MPRRLQLQHQLLETLEKLFNLPAAELPVTMSRAADLVSAPLAADKLDAFLYDPSRESLVAVGVSDQPLSAEQRRHGLDILPLANGGRTVEIFRTGQTFVAGHLEHDEEEVRGVREVLQVRSVIGARITVGERPRGVLLASSLQPDFFSEEDVQFTEIVARWVGVVAHRAELVERVAETSREQGRRAVAEELVTVLAHDLRNYIGPLDMRLQLLRMRAESDGRKADRDDLDLALLASTRLSALVTTLLDVGRIDQGLFELDAEPLELVPLVREVASVFVTDRQPVVVRAPEEVRVAADASRIRQCVENLLANAIRHSPESVPVIVDVEREQREHGDRVRIDVIDEGPGIPPEMMPRLFERFVTGERKQGGLGLGLYLGKRIAVAHGGDLLVESTPGHGARFSLILPCHESRPT